MDDAQQCPLMTYSLPKSTIAIWRFDAVLLDWLTTVALNTVPITHPAEKLRG